MALDSSAVQFLCAMKHHGVDFSEVLTVGKQDFKPRPNVLAQVLETLPPVDGPAIDSATAYFRALGAKTVEAMDFSDYEGATVIHDLNRPLPDSLRGRFGLVYDGGSLEHVFNIPQAYKSLMEMVRVGGWFAQITAANNYLGHGFWQVSPELIFRCFSPENGFELHCVMLKETHHDDVWRAARDPAVVGRRVELVNQSRTYICTLARKTADVEIFATTPQQSDYVALWQNRTAEAGGGEARARGFRIPPGLRSSLRGLVPETAKVALRGGIEAVRKRKESAYDPACYEEIETAALLRGDLGTLLA